MTHRTEQFVNTTHRINSFLLSMTQRIWHLFDMTRRVQFFHMTQIIEHLLQYDSKNWTFLVFQYDSKKDSKNWTFLSWPKELNFFLIWLKELNLLWNLTPRIELFLNMSQRIEPYFTYDRETPSVAPAARSVNLSKVRVPFDERSSSLIHYFICERTLPLSWQVVV